jgi:hypothetical protein
MTEQNVMHTNDINLWWESIKSYSNEMMVDSEILLLTKQLQEYIYSFVTTPVFLYEETAVVVKSRMTSGDDFNEVIDFMSELKQNNRKIFLYVISKVKEESGSSRYIIRYGDIENDLGEVDK